MSSTDLILPTAIYPGQVPTPTLSSLLEASTTALMSASISMATPTAPALMNSTASASTDTPGPLLDPGQITGITIASLATFVLLFMVFGSIIMHCRRRREQALRADNLEKHVEKGLNSSKSNHLAMRSQDPGSLGLPTSNRKLYPKLQQSGAGIRANPSQIGVAVTVTATATATSTSTKLDNSSATSQSSGRPFSKLLPPTPLQLAQGPSQQNSREPLLPVIREAKALHSFQPSDTPIKLPPEPVPARVKPSPRLVIAREVSSEAHRLDRSVEPATEFLHPMTSTAAQALTRPRSDMTNDLVSATSSNCSYLPSYYTRQSHLPPALPAAQTLKIQPEDSDPFRTTTKQQLQHQKGGSTKPSNPLTRGPSEFSHDSDTSFESTNGSDITPMEEISNNITPQTNNSKTKTSTSVLLPPAPDSPISAIRYPKVPRTSNQTVARTPVSPRMATPKSGISTSPMMPRTPEREPKLFVDDNAIANTPESSSNQPAETRNLHKGQQSSPVTPTPASQNQRHGMRKSQNSERTRRHNQYSSPLHEAMTARSSSTQSSKSIRSLSSGQPLLAHRIGEDAARGLQSKFVHGSLRGSPAYNLGALDARFKYDATAPSSSSIRTYPPRTDSTTASSTPVAKLHPPPQLRVYTPKSNFLPSTPEEKLRNQTQQQYQHQRQGQDQRSTAPVTATATGTATAAVKEKKKEMIMTGSPLWESKFSPARTPGGDLFLEVK